MKAFFNVMLKEMGVRGVKVQEVYGLDDEMLAILPYAQRYTNTFMVSSGLT